MEELLFETNTTIQKIIEMWNTHTQKKSSLENKHKITERKMQK